MDRLSALKKISEEAASGKIHFAANTDLALKIRKALDDPDCHMDAAAKLMQADPLLSAQVVAIANSVAYNRSGREITDVKTAVSRLGFATLRSLAMAHVTRQMAGAPNTPELKQLTAQLWQHTTHVAALCRVLAKHVTKQNPDAALFIGLVHEVGGFYLLSRVKDYPALIDFSAPAVEETTAAGTENGDIDDLDDEESKLENALALAVLEKLNMPAAVVDAVKDYQRGFLAMPPHSMGDTLLLAEFLAPIRSPLRDGIGEATNDAAIDINLGEETLAQVLKESAEEVDSIAKALQL